MDNRTAFWIGAGVIAAFTVPIFRSGGRTHLTGWQWLINHTIFGPPVEYIPSESYRRELEGVKITTEVTPISGSIDRVMAYYQISEESAGELIAHQRR